MRVGVGEVLQLVRQVLEYLDRKFYCPSTFTWFSNDQVVIAPVLLSLFCYHHCLFLCCNSISLIRVIMAFKANLAIMVITDTISHTLIFRYNEAEMIYIAAIQQIWSLHPISPSRPLQPLYLFSSL